MAKLKITTLDQLEKLVIDRKISKIDRYNVFKQALKSYPITFIEIILDDPDEKNEIQDKENRLIPQMQKIIAEIRSDPAARQYSCMSITRNESDGTPDILIDFTV